MEWEVFHDQNIEVCLASTRISSITIPFGPISGKDPGAKGRTNTDLQGGYNAATEKSENSQRGNAL